MDDEREFTVVHLVREGSPRVSEFLTQWFPRLAEEAPHLGFGLVCDASVRPSRRMVRAGIEIVRWPPLRRGPLGWHGMRGWVRARFGQQPKIVFHAHGWNAARDALNWGRWCRGRAVVSIYEADAVRLGGRLLAHGVVTGATPGLASGAGSIVLPGGIDPDDFRGSVQLEWAMRSFGFDPRLPRIGMVDDLLVEESGAEVFIQAADRVVAEIPFVEFAIMGDGPYRYSMEREAHRRGLLGRFRFLPLRPDRYSFYSCLHLLVVVNRSAGFPWALIEGIASRVPVLAAETPTHRWMCSNAGVVPLFPPTDPHRLAEAIVDHLRHLPRSDEGLGGLGSEEARLGAPVADLEEYFASFERAFEVEEDSLSLVEEPRTPRARLRKEILERFSLDEITRQCLAIYEQIRSEP